MPHPPRVDLFDPAFKADPYPTYSELRSSAPVHRITLPDGRGVWLITRYEDVLAVFKNERFVKNWREVLTPEQLAQIPPIPEVMQPLSANMLDTDPPVKGSPESLSWRPGMVLRGLQGLPVEF